jgi:hypothetical protein
MELEKKWIIEIITQMNHKSVTSINGMLHPNPPLISNKQFLKKLEYALSDDKLYRYVHGMLMECSINILSMVLDYLGYTYDKNGEEWEHSESNL